MLVSGMPGGNESFSKHSDEWGAQEHLQRTPRDQSAGHESHPDLAAVGVPWWGLPKVIRTLHASISAVVLHVVSGEMPPLSVQ